MVMISFSTNNYNVVFFFILLLGVSLCKLVSLEEPVNIIDPKDMKRFGFSMSKNATSFNSASKPVESVNAKDFKRFNMPPGMQINKKIPSDISSKYGSSHNIYTVTKKNFIQQNITSYKNDFCKNGLIRIHDRCVPRTNYEIEKTFFIPEKDLKYFGENTLETKTLLNFSSNFQDSPQLSIDGDMKKVENPLIRKSIPLQLEEQHLTNYASTLAMNSTPNVSDLVSSYTIKQNQTLSPEQRDFLNDTEKGSNLNLDVKSDKITPKSNSNLQSNGLPPANNSANVSFTGMKDQEDTQLFKINQTALEGTWTTENNETAITRGLFSINTSSSILQRSPHYLKNNPIPTLRNNSLRKKGTNLVISNTQSEQKQISNISMREVSSSHKIEILKNYRNNSDIKKVNEIVAYGSKSNISAVMQGEAPFPLKNGSNCVHNETNKNVTQKHSLSWCNIPGKGFNNTVVQQKLSKQSMKLKNLSTDENVFDELKTHIRHEIPKNFKSCEIMKITSGTNTSNPNMSSIKRTDIENQLGQSCDITPSISPRIDLVFLANRSDKHPIIPKSLRKKIGETYVNVFKQGYTNVSTFGKNRRLKFFFTKQSLINTGIENGSRKSFVNTEAKTLNGSNPSMNTLLNTNIQSNFSNSLKEKAQLTILQRLSSPKPDGMHILRPAQATNVNINQVKDIPPRHALLITFPSRKINNGKLNNIYSSFLEKKKETSISMSPPLIPVLQQPIKNPNYFKFTMLSKNNVAQKNPQEKAISKMSLREKNALYQRNRAYMQRKKNNKRIFSPRHQHQITPATVRNLVHNLKQDILNVWPYPNYIKSPADVMLDQGLINRAKLATSSGKRLDELFNKVMHGKDIKMAYISSSLFRKMSVSSDKAHTLLYNEALVYWYNKVIAPIAGSGLIQTKVEIPNVREDYFTHCLRNHLQNSEDIDLIIWELADLDHFPNDKLIPANKIYSENLLRSMLNFTSRPDMIMVDFYRGNTLNKGTYCRQLNQDIEQKLASYYDCSFFSWSKSVCPYLKDDEEGFLFSYLFSGDKRHPSIIGHAQMAYILIDYIRDSFLKYLSRKYIPPSESPRFLPLPIFSDIQTSLCYTTLKSLGNVQEPRNADLKLMFLKPIDIERVGVRSSIIPYMENQDVHTIIMRFIIPGTPGEKKRVTLGILPYITRPMLTMARIDDQPFLQLNTKKVKRGRILELPSTTRLKTGHHMVRFYSLDNHFNVLAFILDTKE